MPATSSRAIHHPRRRKLHHASKARRPWVIMLLFVITGFRIGAPIDAPTGLTMAIANAAVGGFIAWLCQRVLAKEAGSGEDLSLKSEI